MNLTQRSSSTATCLIVGLALFALLSTRSNAEVRFDGTAGFASDLLIGDLTITETDGLLTPGGEALLHSFEIFNVLANESIEFTHENPTVANILLRVTGPSSSVLQGRLASDAPLWLLNPNGVVVGDEAQLDVAGAFRANLEAGQDVALVLANGSTFAVDTSLNTLTVANPLDFGFLGDVMHSQSVAADSSLASRVLTTQGATGTLHRIDGGTVAGANLFHSFDHFSVFSDETAEFSAATGASINNVISRVTGDSRSFLAGRVTTMGSDLDGASFWFLNPAGIFAGNGLALNVGDAFHLGAADSLRPVGDAGGIFSASLGDDELFTSAPDRFEFVDGGVRGVLTLADFEFTQEGIAGRSDRGGITLAGRDVNLLGSRLNLRATAERTNRLSIDANAGRLLLADTYLGKVANADAEPDQLVLTGAMLVANGSEIRLQSENLNTAPGGVMVRGVFDESVFLNNSTVEALTTGSADSGAIVFQAPQFTMLGGALETRSMGSGAAGLVGISSIGSDAGVFVGRGAALTVDATQAIGDASADLIIVNSTGDVFLAGTPEDPVSLSSNGGPTAGLVGGVGVIGQRVFGSNLVLAAEIAGQNADLAVIGDPEIATQGAINLAGIESVSLANTQFELTASGALPGSNLFISGPDISLSQTAIAISNAGTAEAGVVAIGDSPRADDPTASITQRLSIADTSIDAQGTGQGSGGQVVLFGAESVTLSDFQIEASSAADTVSAGAGQILVSGFGSIEVLNSEFVATTRSGEPGFVAISGNDVAVTDSSVELDFASAENSVTGISLQALQRLDVTGSMLSATTTGDGDALPITLQGNEVSVADSVVSVSSSGDGDAGTIGIDSGIQRQDSIGLFPASSIRVTNSSLLSSSLGGGSFGTIGILGNEVMIEDSLIAVDTSSANQGDQSLAAVNLIGIDDVVVNSSGVVANTTGASDAGRINVSGGNLRLEDSVVTNSSEGTGAAGAIALSAVSAIGESLVTLEIVRSAVSSDTRDGNAGLVQLLGDQVRVTGEGSRISTNSTGIADAGVLNVFGGTIEVSDGASIESRASGTGDSNEILLSAFDTLTLGAADDQFRTSIRTDSVSSRGGDVSLRAPRAVILQNTDIEASAGANGSGGDLDLSTTNLLVSESTLLAQAENGNGGRIDIDVAPAGVFILDGLSQFNADSATGNSGTVNVDVPNDGIVSALAAQDTSFAPEIPLRHDACARPVDTATPSTLFVRSAVAVDPFLQGYLGTEPLANPGASLPYVNGDGC